MLWIMAGWREMAQALENMPTNSRKREMARRMYMPGMFRKVIEKTKGVICNEMKAKNVVAPLK